VSRERGTGGKAVDQDRRGSTGLSQRAEKKHANERRKLLIRNDGCDGGALLDEPEARRVS